MRIDNIADVISSRSKEMPAGQAMLAGISGIDASGKGCLARQIHDELRMRGLQLALINADDWLNLPHIRFGSVEPGDRFYRRALRLDEMFEQLVLPLRANRSIRLTALLTRETAAVHHTHTCVFNEIDIILVEGIFLFKQPYAHLFDLKIWIECSFGTALERAIGRSQEGLNETDTIRAYETIFFPAQMIHLERDDPAGAADIIIDNN